MQEPIIVVGMARSGTTLITDILAKMGDYHVEIEPHALWKSGNFNFFNDEEYSITDSIVQRIRRNFEKKAAGKQILEKSPINCLRAGLVHAVFPNAKIVYIEREPISCIRSNYTRSLSNDSYKLSIILKKYLFKSGTDDLPYATSDRSIFSQLHISDLWWFFLNSFWMLLNRNLVMKQFPFGTKLKDFKKIVKDHGLMNYHVLVLKKSISEKRKYKEFYGDQMDTFNLEGIMKDKSELSRLFKFVGNQCEESEITKLIHDMDKKRVSKAFSKTDLDTKIFQSLKENGIL